MSRNYDTTGLKIRIKTAPGSSVSLCLTARSWPRLPTHAVHKWDVSESWWTYFRGGIKLHKHSPCLCKDGNVFQITDGCMEILVARLDFSELDCWGAGPRGISQRASHECVSSGETPFFFVIRVPVLHKDVFMNVELLENKRSACYWHSVLVICLWSCTLGPKIVIVLHCCWSWQWQALLGKNEQEVNRTTRSILGFISKYFSSSRWPPLRGKIFNKRVGIKYS